LPLNVQTIRADAVVLGRAVQAGCAPKVHRCAHLEEVVFLKGAKPATPSRIEIVLDNRITEIEVDCCLEGKTYLMFLIKRNGMYLPVQGVFSVFDLSTQIPVPLE
jgi:hypothetical protein